MQSILDKLDGKQKNELIDWMNARYAKLRIEIGMESSDVDRKTALSYFKTATEFWSASKPSLGKVGTPIDILALAKTRVCMHELSSLHAQMKKLDLKRDDFAELIVKPKADPVDH